jgi:hypothetical protein
MIFYASRAKFSGADVLARLNIIFKVKINDRWHLSESPKKTDDCLKAVILLKIGRMVTD